MSAAEALEHQCRRLTVLEARLEMLRKRRLLVSWREQSTRLAHKRVQLRRAERHWQGVAGRALMEGLQLGVEQVDPRRQQVATGRLRQMRLGLCFKVRGRQHKMSSRKLPSAHICPCSF